MNFPLLCSTYRKKRIKLNFRTQLLNRAHTLKKWYSLSFVNSRCRLVNVLQESISLISFFPRWTLQRSIFMVKWIWNVLFQRYNSCCSKSCGVSRFHNHMYLVEMYLMKLKTRGYMDDFRCNARSCFLSTIEFFYVVAKHGHLASH